MIVESRFFGGAEISEIAGQLGVIPTWVVSWLPLIIGVPTLFVLANLIAAGPARLAARTPAAVALRAQ